VKFLQKQKTENSSSELMDSIRLGNIAPGQFLQELGKDIKGLKGMFIDISIGGIENRRTASIHVSEGTVADNKEIFSATGLVEQGLSATLNEKRISVVCNPEN
jgi:hypothetical protein